MGELAWCPSYKSSGSPLTTSSPPGERAREEALCPGCPGQRRPALQRATAPSRVEEPVVQTERLNVPSGRIWRMSRMGRTRLFLIGLLGWYVLFAFWMGRSPVDSQFWTLASVPAGLFVTALVMTHRILPLSLASYALITAYLTLHTVGAHYTYAQTPVGFWLDQAMDLQRNHFDRIVHFSFGFLLTYPMEELLARSIPIWASPTSGPREMCGMPRKTWRRRCMVRCSVSP